MTNEAPAEFRPDRPLLIVDDDCDARAGMKDLLEGAGYHVVCMANGEEALRYLRQNPPPAGILLDLFMPVVNGWQFVRQVRAQENLGRVPIILVTGQGAHWGYPVPSVVNKPVDPEALLRTLDQLVRADRGYAA
jgi:CheY-like chemotaxis protein